MEKYIHQLENADFHTRMKVVKAHRKGEKSKKTKYSLSILKSAPVG